MSDISEGRIRSRLIDAGSELQTLINSLTLEQLRVALTILCPQKSIPLKKHADVNDALSKSGASIATITKTLLEVEALAPKKHSFLCSCSRNLEVSDFNNFKKVFSGEFSFRKTWLDDADSWLTISFEHTVQVSKWVEISQDLRKIERLDIRHPIVLRYAKTSGAVFVHYPGFHQGEAIKRAEKIHYDKLIEAFIAGLEDSIGVKFTGLPIERAIGILSEGENSRIRVTKSDVEGGLGRIGVSASTKSNSANSVQDVIASFISENLPATVNISELKTAIHKSFRDAPANSLVVHWADEDIFSRIAFWTLGTEFFFIWNQGIRSLSVIEKTLEDLFLVSKDLIDSARSLIWETLSKTHAERVLIPRNFAANHGMTIDEVAKFFVQAIEAGLVVAVYRLKSTEDVVEMANDWTPKLSILRGIFHTLSGEAIDGSIPENIEVAFKRVGQEANV